MWMNEMDVESAFNAYYSDPILGPAVLTLKSLMNWTNDNSDGWPYWQKPANAARSLMEIVQAEDRRRLGYASYRSLRPATTDDVARALRPIKAFKTRMRADFVIVDFPA